MAAGTGRCVTVSDGHLSYRGPMRHLSAFLYGSALGAIVCLLKIYLDRADRRDR